MTAPGDRSATEPSEVHQLWAKYINEANLEQLLSLYEEDAVFEPQPGNVVRGHDAIRESLAALLAMDARAAMHESSVLQASDLALLNSSWTISGRDGEGNRVELTGITADVVRRQPSGSWLFAIDKPNGGG